MRSIIERAVEGFVKELKPFDGGKRYAVAVTIAGELLTGCVNAEYVPGMAKSTMSEAPKPVPQELLAPPRLVIDPLENKAFRQAIENVKEQDPDEGSRLLDEDAETEVRSAVVADTSAGADGKEYLLSETTLKLRPSSFPEGEATGSVAIVFYNREARYISIRQRTVNAPEQEKMIEDKELFFTTLPKRDHELAIQVSLDPRMFEKLDLLTATGSGVLHNVMKRVGILGGEHAFGEYQVLKKNELETFLSDGAPLYQFTFRNREKPGFTQGVKPVDSHEPRLEQ